MAYINANDIRVFPSTRRVHTQTDARLMTERSISGLINQLINTDGFVITENFDASAPFEFNIFGYYFNATTASAITSKFSTPTVGTIIYGIIKIDITNEYHEIIGQDESDEYRGLIVDSTIPTAGENEEIHYLALLTYGSNGWEIPESSKILFNQNRVDIIDIDGGVIS